MPDFTCSVAARERGEPLAGTALTSRRWVLVEQRAHWEASIAETPPLRSDIGRDLLTLTGAMGGEVFLVRRPGRRPPGQDVQAWIVIDGPTATMASGTYVEPAGLTGALDALRRVRDGRDLGAPAGDVVLVCAHSTRDRCCAVSGRAIAADLAGQHDEVWESSHLGGHRFAGTMLMLPTGVHYGNLDLQSARQAWRAHRGGGVDPAYLRGLTMLAPAGQAAVAEVFRRYPHASLDDVALGDITTVGGLEWEVLVTGAGSVPRHLTLRVQASDSDPLRLSCREDAGKAVRSYRVL